MSMVSGLNRPFEIGEIVASFKEYDQAQKAVSKLIAAEVPAADIAIVGTALRSVEKVTGRLGYAQAAWSGAVNGVLLGLLFAAMVVIWTPGLPISTFAGVLLVGIALGMLFRLIAYSILRRRRDFASVMQVSAEHYDVTVQSRSVGKARQVLGAEPAPARPATQVVTPPAPPVSQEPPRYGVRVDPVPPVPPTEPPLPPTSRPEQPQAPDAQTPQASGSSPEQGAPSGTAPQDEPRDPDRA
ncbi:general stress protein [Microbacterium sp.]|uniref:general stress protein n=1 Tax=Microbacterium sp. TaxID=51671 RepID=UPI002811A4EA|nr:general stress protein [Microbacterium sp.]